MVVLGGPTVAICLGTNGDPMGVGVSYERGTPVNPDPQTLKQDQYATNKAAWEAEHGSMKATKPTAKSEEVPSEEVPLPVP